MQLLFILCNLCLGLVSTNGEPAEPDTCDKTPKTNIGRLKKTIFCGYDSSVRPVTHHSNKTTVKMAAFPNTLAWMMEERNTISMTFVVMMSWQDDLLKWNSSDYDGLEEFHSNGNTIWLPDIDVDDPPQSQVTRDTSCNIHSNGYIDCSKTLYLMTYCTIDTSYFPYDRHHCTINFRPRYYKNNTVSLDFLNVKGTNPFKFYRPHGTWNMISFNASLHIYELLDNTSTEIWYTFVIQRRSSVQYNVTPLAVLMMMVLSVFWLESQCSARIILPGLAILSHMIVLRWLMEVVQSNYENLPVIIMVVRNSLILAGVVLVWSVACRTLVSCSFAPYWLYKTTTFINDNQVIKIFLPHDTFIKSGMLDDEDESSLVVHRDSTEQQWRTLLIFCDRIFFALFLLLYMYFFMSLTP